MPSLNKFVKLHTHTDQIDTCFEEVDPQLIYGTRPFLTSERLKGIRRKGSKELPQLVETNDTFYCIDGHHKVRRAIDNGQPSILCEVAHTRSSILEEALIKICSNLIGKLIVK